MLLPKPTLRMFLLLYCLIGKAKPILINTVREPISRLLSQYSYQRCARVMTDEQAVWGGVTYLKCCPVPALFLT